MTFVVCLFIKICPKILLHSNKNLCFCLCSQNERFMPSYPTPQIHLCNECKMFAPFVPTYHKSRPIIVIVAITALQAAVCHHLLTHSVVKTVIGVTKLRQWRYWRSLDTQCEMF